MQVEIYMFAYILDVICAQQKFLGLKWAWSPVVTSLNRYYKLLSECSFRGAMTRFFDQFVTPVYMMIFEQDPPYMSKVVMEALIEISYWHAS